MPACRTSGPAPWLAAGAVALGAAWAVSARARRRRLARGEIRELASAWATVGGLRVHARMSTAAARPDVPPVVLVHGYGVSSAYFVPLAERLAPRFAVYAPDLPDHGRSAEPPAPLDVPGFAEALVAWMDAVGIGRASLVGNSMGCQIAAEAAVRYPERVDRLVLIGPTADPAAPTVAAHVGRLVAGGLFEWPSLIPLLALEYLRVGPDLAAELRAMLRHRMEAVLPRVTAPVLLLRGEHDFVAPRRWLAEAAGLLGGAPTVEVPFWGHAPHYSAAGAVARALTPFLAAPAGTLAQARSST
jgi:pimeloyl-ACP methyl ester carboxylesterase